MKIIFQSIRLLVGLTILTGILYPLTVTYLAHAAWSEQAEGSILSVNRKPVGSLLLSQKTEDMRYFWPRPSAGDFATIPSGASNLGPSSAALQKTVRERIAKWRADNGLPVDASVPNDMIFSSGSGLDPHISPEAALLQVNRVVAARKFSSEQKEKLAKLVESSVEDPQWWIFGQPRVNVLKLNIGLDQL